MRLTTIITTTLMLLCNLAAADFIGFTSYINTGSQSQVAIQNISDNHWLMTSARVEFVPQAMLGQPGKLLSPGLYGTSTAVTQQGLDSMTLAEVAGRSLTLSFAGMQSGDGAGLKLPIQGNIRGGDIDGTAIVAAFRNGDTTREVRWVFENWPGNGVSYNVTASVPEPSPLIVVACVMVAMFALTYRGRRE